MVCSSGLQVRAALKLTHHVACMTAAVRLCKKYPSVRDALLKSLLETVVKYEKMLAGIEVGLEVWWGGRQ